MMMNHSSPFHVHTADKAQKAADASRGREAFLLTKGKNVQHSALCPAACTNPHLIFTLLKSTQSEGDG